MVKSHRKKDTSKVDVFNTAALEFYMIDNDKLRDYAKDALDLAVKLRFEKGKAEALRLLGLHHPDGYEL
jgi:hypothetical protein